MSSALSCGSAGSQSYSISSRRMSHVSLNSLTSLLPPRLSCIVVLWLLCCVWLSATPWTVAHQAPLSTGFPTQEYWSGLPFSPPQESSWPRDQTHISCVSSTVRQILYHWPTREAGPPVTGPVTTVNFELSSFFNSSSQNAPYWDFSGGPVAKIPHSQCWGPGFHPWWGELDPTCHN